MPALITWWTLDVERLAPEAHNDAVARTGADLLSRWHDPRRRYHTTTHLVELFWALEELEEAGEIDERQGSLARLAAWFHDAVYDPTSAPGSNEADSAALARESLRQLGLQPDDQRRVKALVQLTDGHARPVDDPLAAAFHDADLWILSAEPARFDQYCEQIRQEYAHVDDQSYRQGRSAILAPLLHRDRVYATATAHRQWEQAARVNLGRELARLRDGQSRS